MVLFIINLALLASDAGHSSGGSMDWWHKVEPYLNYPGFEAWKFLNLAIFVYVLYRLLNKPLSEAFKAKREEIRADLIKAEEEKKAAMAELTEAEAKYASIEADAATARKEAEDEAKAEKARIADEAAAEAERLRAQAQAEINRKAVLAKLELRRYSAEESVKRAEELIKQSMSGDLDKKLVKSGIEAIGGAN